MRRGEVWWASLARPDGSGPGYRRPVLVVQSDEFNESRIRTVVVAAITSNTRLAQAPGNVLLSKRASGLQRLSVVNVSQLATIDRSRLTDRISSLPDGATREVEEGLRTVLAL